ncbi:uncharacterized protein C6G9.01c [Cornus florida]|uniref:uncharacterized protein C6G9.01c n=1 Tax=Cornus florida TaxID=4283 RepID=UPI0028A1F5EE|nr:uncharacterized protein C6G9.01c [Cornus florida]
MPKKRASKMPAPTLEDPVVEQESPSSTLKKPIEEEKCSSISKKSGNEIDEIFSGKKRKKAEREKGDEPIEDVSVKSSSKTKKKKSKKSEDSGFVDPPPRPRKRTGDGLVLYTEEELGIGKADAGGTPLCPFDCSCCF